MSDLSCPFCQRIAARQYQAIGEDPEIVWFEPLNPVTPGHLLFVPVTHVTDALDDPYIAAMTMESAASWGRVNQAGPCNLITSAGQVASQSVFHLHVHLVPRRKGDNLHLPWTGQKARLESLVADPRRKSDRILAETFERAGDYASGLDLTPIGEDGHAVANLLWKISGYLKGRAAGDG